jgi:hypothetical protein
MAERKSGPVKPPVIDLKARDASRTDAKPARNRSASRQARPPRPDQDAPAPAVDPAVTAKPSDASPADAGAAERQARTSPEAEAQASPRESLERPRPEADQPRPASRTEPLMPPRRAKLAMPWSAISLAALGGALLGTALTYALVGLLPLPASAPPIADPSERLAALEASVEDLGGRLTPLEAAGGDLRSTDASLRSALAAQDGSITQISQRLDSVAAVAEQTVDLTPLTSQLAALEDRVSAMGAGASSADAAALAESLTGIEAELAELRTQLEAVTAQAAVLDQLNGDLASLRSTVAAQTKTLAGTSIGPVVQLPLLVSGLESAFSAGRPFSTELDALQALLPELDVPLSVAGAADDGLPRADRVIARFETVVPAILAGRAATSTGDLGQDALEWAKALLALRPTGELEGNTPDAIVSRLEAAVAREDFVAASDLLSSLPAPMRSAAGEVGDQIGSLAAATRFIAALRAQALAPVTGTSP